MVRRAISTTTRLGLLAALLSGCASPEDGRPRGGGHGGDAGNYRGRPIKIPSKIDGTRSVAGPTR